MGFDLKFASITMMLLLLTCTTKVISARDTTVTTVLCNAGTYTAGDPFATSLAYVLDELENTTPKRENYDFYNISPYPNAFAYGHGFCKKNLTRSDCADCLGAARVAMVGSCQSRIGARGVLRDCEIRYEQYPFSD